VPEAARAIEQAAPPDRPLGEQIHRLLIELFVRLKEHEDRVLAQIGFTRSQAKALYRLEPGETVPVGVLADRVYADPSNLAGTLDGLVELGLVERLPAAHDRRVRVVRLTPKGAELRARFVQLHQDGHPGSATLSEAERRRFRDLLEKLSL
jgi:DNA-binding MarR family transcriptional regulator